jgi:2-octaprenyl-6-methoxyphenol hydroxylase
VTESRFDIVIAGGGMVGISLALALQAKSCGSRILLVESFPMPVPGSQGVGSYTPSFDARSTALSYASCLIYRELGLWESIAPGAQAIETIHVSNQGRFGSTLLGANDYDWPALGYVVENGWLGQALGAALFRGDVELRSPARVTGVERGQGDLTLNFEAGAPARTKLLVVADGARSELRESLGIAVRERCYEQQAIIANIGHRLSHSGRAYERFTARGPLAMLPLTPAAANAHRSALVWTLPPDQAAALQTAAPDEFLAQLQREFGYRLGRLVTVGERHDYPLALVEAEEQVRAGVVVMGNAAHALHPVAGQGFNLALRGVASLAAVLSEAQSAGLSPGDLEVLERYRQSRLADQRQTTTFSDRLPGLFMNQDLALSLVRDLGLFAMDMAPGIKRRFVRQTAGMAASSEYRDVHP